MSAAAEAMAEWSEFGPPGQTTGFSRATDYACDPCDVAWHRNAGPNCWACGQPGRVENRRIGLGMNIGWRDPSDDDTLDA